MNKLVFANGRLLVKKDGNSTIHPLGKSKLNEEEVKALMTEHLGKDTDEQTRTEQG